MSTQKRFTDLRRFCDLSNRQEGEMTWLTNLKTVRGAAAATVTSSFAMSATRGSTLKAPVAGMPLRLALSLRMIRRYSPHGFPKWKPTTTGAASSDTVAAIKKGSWKLTPWPMTTRRIPEMTAAQLAVLTELGQ